MPGDGRGRILGYCRAKQQELAQCETTEKLVGIKLQVFIIAIDKTKYNIASFLLRAEGVSLRFYTDSGVLKQPLMIMVFRSTFSSQREKCWIHTRLGVLDAATNTASVYRRNGTSEGRRHASRAPRLQLLQLPVIKDRSVDSGMEGMDTEIAVSSN